MVDAVSIPGFSPPAPGGIMAEFTFDFISASDGWRLRTGVFQPEKRALALCVLLTGQTEFIEKYFEVIAELNARGYIVATFDWRGQGGSQRALRNPLKAHIGDFAEYDTDLLSFMDQVAAKLSPVPPLVLAHSLGSHLALRALHDHPSLFRAAVLVAPMLGIATRGYPQWLTRSITALQARMGKTRRFAWGMAERDPFRVDFGAQLCTSDAVRFRRTQTVLRAHPQIRLAGPTWGWIAAAYRSMKQTAATGYAEAIKTPVLIAGAGKDRIVLTEATRRFAARLPRARYVEFEGSEHEILMETDAIRMRFWAEFDGFVAGL
jgi:lysophospholipase